MKGKIDRKKFSRQQTEKLSECSRAIYIRAVNYIFCCLKTARIQNARQLWQYYTLKLAKRSYILNLNDYMVLCPKRKLLWSKNGNKTFCYLFKSDRNIIILGTELLIGVRKLAQNWAKTLCLAAIIILSFLEILRKFGNFLTIGS